MYRMTKLVNLAPEGSPEPDFEMEPTSIAVESLEEAVRITGADMALPNRDDTGLVEHWLLVPRIAEGEVLRVGWALHPVRMVRGDRHDVDRQIRNMMKKDK
ncbi:hypothetical protein SEA_REYNAULD_54 [Rhodococcus phage Reynauld]|uniref:Uncharacterized protein n=1 Tax=Rhodococcus phage Reynauld TaxID=3062845 RepID=A0ACD4UJ73_9CAUD|nr:hypothetical protein SEA_REYNAULD_54 [Rhodococcus phage Reynauld]